MDAQFELAHKILIQKFEYGILMEKILSQKWKILKFDVHLELNLTSKFPPNVVNVDSIDSIIGNFIGKICCGKIG